MYKATTEYHCRMVGLLVYGLLAMLGIQKVECRNEWVTLRAHEVPACATDACYVRIVGATGDSLQAVVKRVPGLVGLDISFPVEFPGVLTGDTLVPLAKATKLRVLLARNLPLICMDSVSVLAPCEHLQEIDIGLDETSSHLQRTVSTTRLLEGMAVIGRCRSINLDRRLELDELVAEPLMGNKLITGLSLTGCRKLPASMIEKLGSSQQLEYLDASGCGTAGGTLNVNFSALLKYKALTTLKLEGHTLTFDPDDCGAPRALEYLAFGFKTSWERALEQMSLKGFTCGKISLGYTSIESPQSLGACLRKLKVRELSLIEVSGTLVFLQSQAELIGSLGALSLSLSSRECARLDQVAIDALSKPASLECRCDIDVTSNWEALRQLAELPGLKVIHFVGSWAGCDWKAWNPGKELRRFEAEPTQETPRRSGAIRPPAIVLQGLARASGLTEIAAEFDQDTNGEAFRRLLESPCAARLMSLDVRLTVTKEPDFELLSRCPMLSTLALTVADRREELAATDCISGLSNALASLKVESLSLTGMGNPDGLPLSKEVVVLAASGSVAFLELSNVRLTSTASKAVLTSPKLWGVRFVDCRLSAPTDTIQSWTLGPAFIAFRACADVGYGGARDLQDAFPHLRIVYE